jgi:hypothetical protein
MPDHGIWNDAASVLEKRDGQHAARHPIGEENISHHGVSIHSSITLGDQIKAKPVVAPIDV